MLVPEYCFSKMERSDNLRLACVLLLFVNICSGFFHSGECKMQFFIYFYFFMRKCYDSHKTRG